VTTLCLLGTELEVLSPLDYELLFSLTFLTFKTKDDLTSGLGLLVKHGLGLPTETHLFGVVTAFSLCKVRGFSSLVLSDLVHSVLTAFASSAVGFAFLGYVNHFDCIWEEQQHAIERDEERKCGTLKLVFM